MPRFQGPGPCLLCSNPTPHSVFVICSFVLALILPVAATTMTTAITVMVTAMGVQSPVRVEQPELPLAEQRGQRRLLPAHVELRQDRDEPADGGRLPHLREQGALPGIRVVSGGGRQVEQCRGGRGRALP